MKTPKIIIHKILFLVISLVLFSACEREETLQPKNIFENGDSESTTELDQYLKTTFRDPYGSIIHYKFVDQFIDPTKSATPPRLEVVKPVSELIEQAWIQPYNVASDQGESFLNQYFPAEIVILGSPIFNSNGTITLGIADSGVRVTLTQANDFIVGGDNTAWTIQTFRTLHHEFAHIIDQTFQFDIESFFNISKDNYTSSGTWFTISETEAIERGMVTPYATSAPGEDFAETIAFIITTDPAEFESKYLDTSTCTTQACTDGKNRIREKYDRVIKYMNEDVGIDLLVLRDEFLKSIN
ncbi:substrate import-associated zinc metallohydrolase lipoprotein [Aquimarina algiphila]|uniref:substrate import-associated zinc metallohydrolase lipoprotein n=1 Tax=Aquimarina algiphila TaxID=2047982 RepID=UPI00232CF3F1|nr:substrate import-associated zinc metallohydrolase lipoprotein [Aquimarina algiphila]